MTRRYRTKATPPQLARISRSVALHDAAQSFCPRASDVLVTMRNALHEAAHVVIAAWAGMHAEWVYIPRRAPSGSRIPSRVPSGKANAWSSFTHPRSSDAVSALEEAVADLAGCVAEAVTDPCQLPPTFTGTTDAEHAKDLIERHLGFLTRIADDPIVYARIHAELQTQRFAGVTVAPDHSQFLLDATSEDAVSLFARHFELIDAVATILLSCASSTGDIDLFRADELSSWVRGQISNARVLHRTCTYKRPVWLRAKPLCAYAVVRAEYKRLGAIL